MFNKILLPAMAVLLVSFWSCQETVDTGAEKEAIKQVIQAQLDAVSALSLEGEAAVWAQTPYIERRGIQGWDSVSVFYRNAFESWSSDSMNYQCKVFTASNFDIHLNGTFASVVHDEHHEYVLKGEEQVHDGTAHKYLEKIDGEWKIIALF